MSLNDVAPTAPTACAGWAVHDIVAHLAAGSKEIADLVEEQLSGKGSRPTQLCEVREPQFRALTPVELHQEWSRQIQRKLSAQRTLADRGPDQTFDFTGMAMTATQLETHSRSEAAIHRWDIVGDDPLGDELLAQPDLTTHAITILNEMPILNESACNRMTQIDYPFSIVLRAEGQPDVVLSTRNDMKGSLKLHDEGAGIGDAVVVSDAAHRLLILWGRRSPLRQITFDCDPALVQTVGEILWPVAMPWAGHRHDRVNRD
jgi:uncharacterized protein (TIGR03083 family)